VGFLEGQLAVQLGVLLVKSPSGDEYSDFHAAFMHPGFIKTSLAAFWQELGLAEEK
jgi:hypothetical protein